MRRTWAAVRSGFSRFRASAQGQHIFGPAGARSPRHQHSAVPAAVRRHLCRHGHDFGRQLQRAADAHRRVTVTVFSTVGFGDITAKTEMTRLVITRQMIVDLVALGLTVKVIVGAVKQGRQRQPASD
jgi:hypothetical protein